jgi:hypothetical protein
MADILKDISVVAFVPLTESVFTQLKGIKKRRAWVQEKTREFGSLGGTHWAIDSLSIWISGAVAAVAIVSSLSYLATHGLGWSTPPGSLKALLDWNDNHYAMILFVWLLHTILVYTNSITRLLWAVVWLIPTLRDRLGFTNATWHIRQGEKAPAIAITREKRQRIPGDIANSLVSSADNANLALRPVGMSDVEAANVLFFGHIIECAMTENNVRWNGDIWTSFYQALGAVAKLKDHPFAAEAINSFSGASFHQQILMQIDQHRPTGLPAVPQDYQIPSRVDEAQRFLAIQLGGDARELGRGVFGYSYNTYLTRSRKVPQLALEEIRRQFAKLAIMWRLTPKARHPKEFKIPFSRSIAIYLLDQTWLRTDAARLEVEDIYFLNAFDVAESSLVSIAATIIDTAKDTPTKNWRDAQKREATKLSLDWDWYLRYRIDQHVYHLARKAAASGVWRTGDKSIERVAPAAAAA